jgi:predicted kinase
LRDSSKAVLKNIKDNGEASTFKTSKKQAKEAQVFINAIGSYYGNKIKEGSLDYVDLAMLNKMFLSNMQAPIRKAAYVGWLGDGVENTTPENMGGDLEFEHMVTASVKTLEVMESIINNGKVDNSIYNDYTIAIIPSAMNDVLTENGLRNFMNIGWKKGDPPWRRYYNAQTLGDNRLVTIRSIDPKDKGIIDSKIQSFVNVSKIFNKKTIKRNKNILIAAKHKFSKSIKGDKVGMSTFDFDDTLARTKSGVRATIPNTDGKPKPKKKVIFLAGGAGSGKSNVVNKLGLEGMGMKIVNQDISLEWLKKNHGLPEDMRNLTKEQRSTLGKLGHQARGIAKRKMMKFQGQGDGVVVDGTGASAKNMQKLVDEFEGKGYDVGMIFVETSLETSLARNRARKERSLLDIIVRKNHEAVMGNKSTYAQVFGDRFMEVNTDNLTQKDPMPKELVNKANDFISGYEKVRLDAEEFAAKGEEILKKGGKFDFSEFNNVVDGSPGPLLDKAKARAEKYGTKDMFVLTARPAESAAAIQAFLKDQGLNIPIKNITGLANSTGEAKAQWMLEKFAEGYNDMYFVDDAIQNVEAVKEVLDQLDVKSDVVQAKVKFSKNANKEFNDMLERSAPEIKSGETISDVNAKMRARKISLMKTLKLNIFIPPSAEDFKGLLYNFLGEGKQGEKDLQFFKEHLLTPYAKANRVINNTKQKMSNEYADLKKNAKDVNLKEKVEGVDLVATNDMAVRVYLWTKAGFEIPGLSTQEQTVLVDRVKNDTSLLAFAEGLSGISRMPNGYIKPSNNWFVESIAWDLNSIANTNLRGEFLQEWKDNKDIIFSKENLNKIEAIHGSGFREALENMLYRMEHGKNRLVGKDSVVNGVLDWINGSVGATMFWNTRSAALQTISTVNFINWQDNNPLAVGKAFANQKQFWKDFSFIFNSDMLKQRRAGLQIDVSASELGNAFETGGRSASAIIGYLLQQGFTPTRIADSFAIAFGGASFYRNRFNKYIKEGMSEVKAKEKAFLDFQEIAEETQQSSRPDLISQQQAGILGRIVLAWQNTPMQMTRLTKKAISDLANNRGSVKSNISKILYYGAIQNLIFGTLQSGLAWAMFGDDDEAIKQREIRVANGMLDTLLRGTGIYGAAISTLKNTILQWRAQSKKGYGKRQDWRIAQEMVNISPPLGSKLRKIMNAVKTEEYNKGVGDKLGLRIENPNLSIGANIIEATTNIPAGRVLNKANNIEEAFTGNMKLWQRTALIMGWSTWDVGIKDEELEKAKIEVKEDKKIEKEKKRLEEKEKKRLEEEKRKKEEEERKKREGIKTVQCSGIRSNGSRCKLTTETKDKSWKCIHHSKFEDGMDRDNDGKPEYQCTATTGSGNRCKNKTENKNKKCYAHQ